MTRVALFAYHEYGAIALEELQHAGAEVAALITHADSPNEEIWYRTPAPLAEAAGIPVFKPEDVNSPSFVERLRELRADLILSVYFRQLICREILDLPPLGALNLHGSLLPRYRGRCPVNWVLVHGESRTGVTLHHMVERADAGDIVAQAAVEVPFTATALTLHHSLFAASRRLLREHLPSVLDGTAPRHPQDESEASYFGGRGPEDGRLEWSQSAVELYNLVRAVTHPYPGAFTDSPRGRLFVWQAWPLHADQVCGTPGRVLECSGAGALVACAKGVLRLERVQLAGDVELPAASAVAARWLQTGDRLGSIGSDVNTTGE